MLYIPTVRRIRLKIYIENLMKKYDDNIILDIQNLEIEEGKITGITGPNGAGKSTLLNILGGIDTDFIGKIKYDDLDFNKEIAKNMTFVFQKPYLFRRTVYDNIAYPLRLRNVNKETEESLVKEIIKDLEIGDLIDKKGHRLSGGESQKVALARGLVFIPKLLLLDEPTSNIDPESIKIMEREILKFNKKTNSTVIIVTHNLEQSQRICDNIIYLQGGRIGE